MCFCCMFFLFDGTVSTVIYTILHTLSLLGALPMCQIQSLDRTQPGQPMKKGRAVTMTVDAKRHGTTTLFAALSVLDGTVIGRNMQRREPAALRGKGARPACFHPPGA